MSKTSISLYPIQGVMVTYKGLKGNNNKTPIWVGCKVTDLKYTTEDGKEHTISGRVVRFVYLTGTVCKVVKPVLSVLDMSKRIGIIVDCSEKHSATGILIPLDKITDFTVEITQPSDVEVTGRLPIESTSKFSTKYDSETTTAAVASLEKSIETDASGDDAVFTEEQLPNGAEYTEFLGVYNVTAEPNDYTLASPNQISTNDVGGVVVMHYDEENGTWDEITDKKVVNNYVYAKFDSFSPVAVYVYKRKPYMTTINGMPSYIANGVPIVISEREDGVTIVTDANGVVTECAAKNMMIFGGTYNEGGTVEKTSVTMNGGRVKDICGGSINLTDEQAYVNESNVVINGGVVSNCVGAGVWRVRIKKSNITINGGTVLYPGSGVQTYFSPYKDVNPSNPSEESPSYVLSANITVNDADRIDYLYNGGSSGYGYIKKAICTINGGTLNEILGPSNGTGVDLTFNINGGHIATVGSINRGTLKNVIFNMTGGTVDTFYLGGNTSDSSVTGVVEKISAKITGCKCKLNPGTSGGVEIAAEDNKVIRIVIVKDANVSFSEGFEEEFGDIIRYN